MPNPPAGSPCAYTPAGTTTPVTIANCQQIVASSTLVTFETGYAFNDTGVLVGLALGAVVAGVIALMGLGFGIRHVRKWITGRKF